MSKPELKRSRVLTTVRVVIAAGMTQHMECTGKSNLASFPAASTIFDRPDRVNGVPRSVTKTNRPSGQSRLSCRNARISSPLSGCVDGTPFFFRARWYGQRDALTIRMTARHGLHLTPAEVETLATTAAKRGRIKPALRSIWSQRNSQGRA